MTLEDRIMQDLKEAMKAKDQAALRGIRAIKSAILLERTSGSKHEISTEVEMQLLQRLLKQRKESMEIFAREGREDLAEKEREEIQVIEKYLPEQLSEAELEAEVRDIITQTGASSMKDMGKVMGAASKKLAGKSDNKSISEMVKRLLS